MDAYVSATRKLSASVKRRRLARFREEERKQRGVVYYALPLKVYIIFLIGSWIAPVDPRRKISRLVLILAPSETAVKAPNARKSFAGLPHQALYRRGHVHK